MQQGCTHTPARTVRGPVSWIAPDVERTCNQFCQCGHAVYARNQSRGTSTVAGTLIRRQNCIHKQQTCEAFREVVWLESGRHAHVRGVAAP